MQIISTINSFVQLQGTSYYKKNNFTFCPGKSRENSINIFQDLQTKFKDFQGFSRTAKKIQDFSRMWQPWLTMSYLYKTKTIYCQAKLRKVNHVM